MSGHLCLKWNNHSSAFLKSISNIQIKERYCDATIACQGRYFPVHRVVLSTCSDYFDEMFERMQCQHPYIVFKDIEPREMELLLNYMYQGEVNVVQEMLPTLIKAAEALKVKGLAVPDDLPAAKESTGGKKRSSTSNDSSQPKRRSEENKRRRRDSSEFISKNLETSNSADNSHTTSSILPDMEHIDERPLIKEEPLDPSDYGNESLPRDVPVLPHSSNSQPLNKEESVFVNFPITDDSSAYVKTEDNLSSEQPYEEQQPSAWSDFGGTDGMQNMPQSDSSLHDDIYESSGETSHSDLGSPPQTSNLTSESSLLPEMDASGSRTKNFAFYGQYRGYDAGEPEAPGLQFGHRPFPCSLCPLQFNFRYNLKRHMLIHSGKKPFQCPNCSCRFRHNNSLKRHLNKKNRCSWPAGPTPSADP